MKISRRTNRVAVGLRLALGLVFCYSSLDKLRHPRLFADAVAGFELLPENLVTLVAVLLPWLELVAGFFLVLGLLSYSSALVLGVLSGCFGLAVATATFRGLDITCGCFDLGEGLPGWGHVVFDGVLLISSVFLFRHGPGSPCLDQFFAIRHQAERP